MSDLQRRTRNRQRIRTAVRVVVAVWAGLAALLLAVGLLDDASWAVRGPGLALIAIFGFGPLGLHMWWCTDNPLVESFSPLYDQQPVHPPYSPLGRLERIGDAADQLWERRWIPQADYEQVTARIDRLTDLAMADERSVELGGTPSPVIAEEIERLHLSVLGLLDAAIDSAAVAPGDADLDTRLRHHLDVLHSRQQAVGEIEDRQDGRLPPG